MKNVEIITKIADSVAKKFGCRLKCDDSGTICYEGPEDCKDFIVEEANIFLRSINMSIIDPKNVRYNEKTV